MVKKHSVLIFIVSSVCIFFMPITLTSSLVFKKSIFDNTSGTIGDTIGGTTAPFVGLLGIFFTFLAFWAQVKANEEQRKDIDIERFENKFFQMIAIYRENALEIGYTEFIYMFNELRFCYFIINECVDWRDMDIQKKQELLSRLSYKYFLDGAENPARNQYISIEENRFLVILEGIRDCYFTIKEKKTINEGDIDNQLKKLHPRLSFTKKQNCISLKINDISVDLILHNVPPFDGHLSKLGHYYCHLFQSVRYIDTQKDNVFKNSQYGTSKAAKYEYIKILRAQLSSAELVLLYFNTFYYGEEWIPYIKEYRFIKRIPLHWLDFGISPTTIYHFDFEQNELERKYKI